MKPLLLYILIFTSTITFSQSLSPTSQKIKAAYNELKKDSTSTQKQLAYLKIFPSTKKQFMTVFQSADYSQLYNDSHEYIKAFIGLAKYYPTEVIEKSITIGKSLTWEADATGDMQGFTVILGVQHIRIFAKKLNALPKEELNKLATFLADAENHKAYPEYQRLIDALRKTGETKLASQFIHARTMREKEPNH